VYEPLFLSSQHTGIFEVTPLLLDNALRHNRVSKSILVAAPTLGCNPYREELKGTDIVMPIGDAIELALVSISQLSHTQTHT
jgi:hypothetical protein